MEIERTAVDTITGYYYQFDYFILELLNRNHSSDTVCIEAIEDVDIHTCDETTAVQCKYHSKTEYNHSVIAEPIRLMLAHFKANPAKRNTMNYRIYGHFNSGQAKLNKTISVNFLKTKFLTFTEKGIQRKYHTELNLTDEELQIFLNHLFIDINAIELREQEKKIIRKLKELFSCNDFDAEYYYYNNALRLVKQLSTEQAVSSRTISKADFIGTINKKQYLFDSWYLEYRGVKDYCKAVRKQYFSPVNTSPYERFFLIECDQQVSVPQINSLLLKISKNWSRLSKKEPTPFCPYVYLHNVSEQVITTVKQSLQNDNIFFTDGYDFKGASFKVGSIIRKATFHTGVKLKFISELSQLEDILSAISVTRIIFQFFIDKPFYKNEFLQHYPIQVRNTMNVGDMI